MAYSINKVIKNILEFDEPAEVADKLGVSTAMISTWKNKDNDFTPRLPIARKIYNEYSVEVWPYSTEALSGKSGD